jgi:hypothetical protein
MRQGSAVRIGWKTDKRKIPSKHNMTKQILPRQNEEYGGGVQVFINPRFLSRHGESLPLSNIDGVSPSIVMNGLCR